MFSIFKKSPKFSLHDLSVLKTDMHSHLIPGIDDGAKDIEDSLNLIRQLQDLGYQSIITTPHVYQEYYPNKSSTILSGLQAVRSNLKEKNLALDFFAAAEYYMDEHFEQQMESHEGLLTFGNNYVLVEMSFFGAPPKLENYIFSLQMKGYKPILAHPERYSFFEGKVNAYARLKDLGCILQVNLLSLAGHYGRATMETAQKLIKANLVGLLGTDLHHQRHLDTIRTSLNNKSFAKFVLDFEYMNSQLLK